MAKNGKQPERQPWEVDFVSVELDSEQKKQLLRWDGSYELTAQTIGQLLLNGHKVSFTHDKGNDCTIVACTAPKPSDGTRQWCLVSRGPSYIDAARVLAYKVAVVLDGDTSGIRATAEARSQWG